LIGNGRIACYQRRSTPVTKASFSRSEAIKAIPDLNEVVGTLVVEAPEVSPKDYVPFERVLELWDRSAHMQLKKDLVENIWNKNYM
jgi:hypothetical protein